MSVAGCHPLCYSVPNPFLQIKEKALWLGRMISSELPKQIADFAARIWFVFKMNLHHLIPVAVAGIACFIPALIPGGASFSVAIASSVGALATAFSYFSYQLMNSWGLYPYDFIEIIEPAKHFIERPERAVERIAYYLSKSEENNVLLVGEPGIGKTTLARGLAEQIVKNRSLDLVGHEVLYLNLDKLNAVNQAFGQFDSRILEILKVLQNKKIILIVDEAHRLFSSGSGSPLSDRLKTYPSLRLLAITTLDDYEKYFKRDVSFTERFNLVKLTPMDDRTTLKLLKEKFPKTEEEVLEYLLEQSKILHPNQAQPRSALQLAINERNRHAKEPASKKSVDETVAFEKASINGL